MRDSTGAVVPEVTITVTSTETNLQRTGTTNSAGLFSVPDLSPGKYRVQVSRQGFETRVLENIELVVGQQLVLNTALQVGEISQQVTVTSEAPLVDTSTSQVAGLVAERQVKDLPLNGRSFDNLISLNPAMVSSTGIKQTTSSSTGPGNYFSNRWQASRREHFLVERSGIPWRKQCHQLDSWGRERAVAGD